MAYPRPSTSGGPPSTRRGGNSTFDKRMSRDDSFLTTSSSGRGRILPSSNNRLSRDDSYIRDRMPSMSPFHTPGAASTLTPANSPPRQAMRETWVPIGRLDTPESMTSGEIPIGMALGSPAHIPSDAFRWQAQFPSVSPPMAEPPSKPSPMPNGSLQRKKTGRQKLFGLFGGGKKHATEEAKGGLSTSTKGSVGSTSTMTSTMSPAPKTPKISRTPTRRYTETDTRDPRNRAAMSRSHTMPYNMAEEPMTSGSNFSSGTDPYLRQQYENLPRAPPIPPVPRLDVSIPDTKLERYSVMFSDVLKGSGNSGYSVNSEKSEKSKHEPAAASLLTRRQATLTRLKTINGNNGGYPLEPVREDDRPRPRRTPTPSPMTQSHSEPASSYVVEPQPAPSTPRLSVFPMPPGARPALTSSSSPETSRVARSNTPPGRLPSPTHGAFDKRPVPPFRGASNFDVPNPFEMNPPDVPYPIRPARSQEPIYPTDTSFHFGPERSAFIPDSPMTVDSVEEIVISHPYRPVLHEPQWQPMSPATRGPASASSATTPASSQYRGRSPSTASGSTHTHMTKPSSELDATDATLANAVEVSIARQISLSRQQRNLLRPLTTTRRSPAEPTPTPPRPAMVVGESRSPLGVMVVRAPSPARFGRDEPIRETKSSTPTLVHRPPSSVDPQNRKSSWIVLDESE